MPLVMTKKKHVKLKQRHQPENVPDKTNTNLLLKDHSKTTAIFLLLIGLATVIVYARSVGYGLIYNWDDAGYILKNEYIRSLSLDSIAQMFSSFYMHNYHPLTTLTYAIEYSIAGESSWIYHLNNLAFHLINTWLVFLLIKKLFRGKEIPALLVAALFALHPMHVESVAWVSERKDVLYTLFYLLALIFYVKYLETGRIKDFILTALFFVMSCLSKSAAVTLPVLLFALDYLWKRPLNVKIVVEKIPLFLVSLVFGILAIRSQDTAIQDLTPMLSVFERLLIVCWGVCLYFFKAVFPISLSAFYPYPLKISEMLPWYYFLAPLVLLLTGYFIWYSRKWGREVVFGFAFFFITISLVLQLMPVGGAIIAERYTYVPYLGLFFVMVVPISRMYDTISGKLVSGLKIYLRAFVVLVIIYAFLSYNRVGYWKDGDVLFTDVIEKYPKLPYAYNNRGFLYFDYYALKIHADNEVRKNAYVEKALADYTMAIQLDPTYKGAYANRAVLLYNTGRPQPALEDFNILLSLDPEHSDGLIGRANTLSSLEMYHEAIPDYEAYLILKPDDEKALLWRGIAYAKTGEDDKALSDFNRVTEVLPDDYEAYYWKGIVFYQKKMYPEALESLNLAVFYNPDNLELYAWRGLVFYELKEYDKAVYDYSTAIEMNPGELSNYINRSIAYNAKGKYQEAYSDLIYAAEKGYPISKSYFESLVKRL
jgi:protein O-mannosyl-transferase